MKRYFLFIICISLIIASLSNAELDIKKLDPILRPLISDRLNYMLAPSSVLQFRDIGTSNIMLNTIIKLSGDANSIRKIGIRIRTIAGNIVTADVPVQSLEKLISLQNVIYVQSARRLEISRDLQTMIDVSVPEIGANQAWNGTPSLTGKDVLVAIIDTGIDWKHPAFLDKNGKSRILYIWDQTIHNPKRYPNGFMFGTEWTKGDIDSGICTEIDEAGHGTHVAGIIAGDERATNCFTGVAPDANLIVIKSDFYDANVIDATRYIFNKADSLRKPVVINMSFGSNWGPHDGTEFLDQALDELIDRPGRMIVSAAGNTGGKSIHLRVNSLRQSSNGNYPWVAIRPLIGADFIPLQIWYEPNDFLSARLLLPKNKNGDLDDFGVGWTQNGDVTSFIIPDGPLKGAYVTIDSSALASDDMYPNYNNTNIYISNMRNLSIPLDNYIYALEFDGSGSSFHAYIPHYAIFTNNLADLAIHPDKSYLLSGDGDYTINSPSSANKIISVASYVTKTEWIDSENRIRSDQLSADTVSAFSSRGPLMNGVQKPEISAPGQMIISAYSSDSWDNSRFIYRDNNHVVLNGTSMSSPHVVGAVALMFQQNPNLSSYEIRDRLISTATDKGPSGWDRAWGYGKLNVLSALNVPAVPYGFEVIPANNAVILKWLPNNENNIAGYKIYSSEGLINLGNVTTYRIENLKNGTPIKIQLSAYNLSGNESQKTREIIVIPKDIGQDNDPPESPKGLQVISVNEALYIKWQANTEYDIQGYKIYYGSSSRNYDRSSDVSNVNEYILKKLNNGSRIYLAISAYDKTNNESIKSDEVSAVPTLFTKSEFRYQKGFPQKIGQDIFSSPAIYDIDNDGRMEIALTSRDGTIYVFRYDGSYQSGFPISTGKGSTSSPAICDVDGDGLAEIISAMGNEIHIWHNNGDVLHGWHKTVDGQIMASPVIGDVDNDGEAEIIIGTLNNSIYLFNRDGSIANGFPFQANGSILSSPAIGDINDDKHSEIIFGTSNYRLYAIDKNGDLIDGFPIELGTDVRSSPVIADINGDGKVEIIICNANGTIFVLKANGKHLSGFPVDLNDIISVSPAIGNLDDDSTTLEIVVCSKDGQVYAYRHDGVLLDGFPVPLMHYILSSPIIADINDDGKMDIVLGTSTGLRYTGLIYALDRFGKKIEQKFPIGLDGNIINSSPAISDIDGDGDIELIACSSRIWDGNGGQLHVWDLPYRINKDNLQWSQFCQNPCHTGYLNNGKVVSSIDVYDYSEDDNIKIETKRQNTVALYQNYPNPFNPGTWLPYQLAYTDTVIIRIYDINGQLVKTLDLGMKTAGAYINKSDSAYWNGKDDNENDVSSGIYFYVLKTREQKITRKMILLR